MSKTTDCTFAVRLAEVRALRGLTQQQLADRVTAAGFKMHRSAIAKIETRQRPVGLAEAVALACALDTPLTALLGDVDDGERDDARIELGLARREVEKRRHDAEQATLALGAAEQRLTAAQARYDGM